MITDAMVQAALAAYRCDTTPAPEETRMRRALEDAERAAWIPMETPPPDGQEVLTYLPGLDCGGMSSDRWDSDASGGPDWYVCSDAETTHWRHMPALPESEE